MIRKVILYNSGLVVCRDSDSRQCLAYQGIFRDIETKLKELESDIETSWYVIVGGELIELSHEAWIVEARRITYKDLDIKPLDERTEIRLRLLPPLE